jgi:hypothetical protein
VAFHRELEAEVGHHGRDEGPVGERAALRVRLGEDAHDLVAVDDLALFVGRDAAVRVTVEGDARVRPVTDGRRRHATRARRAVALVDVLAVGVRADDDDLGAGATERLRTDLAAGTVRRVDDDLEAVERVGDRRDDVVDVAPHRGEVLGHATDVRADGTLPPLAEPRLDLVLDVVVELGPGAVEELDAVVGHRVVRGGDHHAEVGVRVGREVGDRRGRHHADVDDVDPGAREPCADRCGEELSGCTRVSSDDGLGPVAGELAALAEDVRRSDRQVERELGRHVAVRDASHAVSSEKSSHGVSSCPRELSTRALPTVVGPVPAIKRPTAPMANHRGRRR